VINQARMVFGLFLNGFGLCAGAELKFTVVHDPEALRKDNPVENKYLKLMRYNRGLLDKDLKPDQKERNQLKVSVGLADYWLVSIQVLTDVRYDLFRSHSEFSTTLRRSNSRPRRRSSCGSSASTSRTTQRYAL